MQRCRKAIGAIPERRGGKEMRRKETEVVWVSETGKQPYSRSKYSVEVSIACSVCFTAYRGVSC
jgi:hypothetical protein